MRRLTTLALSWTGGMLLAACATLEGPVAGPPRGTSGPVAWEVVDIRQTRAPDGREIKWDYTVVLRETTGTGIQLEKVEVTGQGPRVIGGPREASFRRRLDAHGELRQTSWYLIYFTPNVAGVFGGTPGGAEGVTLYLRYYGRDDRGMPVTVTLEFRLDPSVGR